MLYYDRIRYNEVFLAASVPLSGIVFSMNAWHGFSIVQCVFFSAALFCFLSHVYVFNDWAEARMQPAGENSAEKLEVKKLFLFSIFLVVIALLLYWMISLMHFFAAGAMFILSFLYSSPTIRLKNVPVVSSVAHFFGAVILFLSGYGLFHPIDNGGIRISVYFALLICAGQLIHEAGDYGHDSALGIRTNAVWFGVEKTFYAGFAVFSIAFLYVLLLAAKGVVAGVLSYGAVATYGLHTVFLLIRFVKALAWKIYVCLENNTGYCI